MPNTSSPLERQRHSSCRTLDVAKALIFWQSSSAELGAVLGWCAGCEDAVEGDGWVCAVGSEQEQPMGLGQCWFNTKGTVLSQLGGTIFQECGILSASAWKGEDKGAAGGQRQQQRPRWRCCCCSGSDLGSSRIFTLWDVSREGVVYLKYPGRRRDVSWASNWKRIC